MTTQRYIYTGTTPTGLPGVGRINPGQVFEYRYGVINNPLFQPTTAEVTEIDGSVPGCDKCVAKPAKAKAQEIKAKDQAKKERLK